jgi:uncharacterized protein (TIGR03435 family)
MSVIGVRIQGAVQCSFYLCRGCLLFALSCLAVAETPPHDLVSFEVASIRVDQSSDGRGVPRFDSDRLSWRGATLKRIICEAYQDENAQVVGAPRWADTERYAIVAKAERPATQDQLRKMLQSLLAERFGLVFRRESKNLLVYVLAAVKGAVKVKPGTEGQQNPPEDKPPVLNQFSRRVSMAQLASLLSDMISGPIFNGYTGMFEPRSEPPTAVLDRTGLSGIYDIQLRFDGSAEGDIASNLDQALSGLGPKLEMRRMPLETLVVTLSGAERGTSGYSLLSRMIQEHRSILESERSGSPAIVSAAVVERRNRGCFYAYQNLN